MNLIQNFPRLSLKTIRHYIGLRQDRFLGIRKRSNLLPFRSISLSVFFSVNPFFRCRRPMNIMGIVADKSQSPSQKLYFLIHLLK